MSPDELQKEFRHVMEQGIKEAERCRDETRLIHEQTIEIQQEMRRLMSEIESEARAAIAFELPGLSEQVAEECLTWLEARLRNAKTEEVKLEALLKALTRS